MHKNARTAPQQLQDELTSLHRAIVELLPKVQSHFEPYNDDPMRRLENVEQLLEEVVDVSDLEKALQKYNATCMKLFASAK